MMEQTSKQPSPSGSNLNSVYNWYTAPYVSDAAAASVFHVPLRLSGFSQPCRRNDGADAQTAVRPSGSNLNSVYNWYTAPYVSDAAAASVLPCAFATLALLAAVQTQ